MKVGIGLEVITDALNGNIPVQLETKKIRKVMAVLRPVIPNNSARLDPWQGERLGLPGA